MALVLLPADPPAGAAAGPPAPIRYHVPPTETADLDRRCWWLRQLPQSWCPAVAAACKSSPCPRDLEKWLLMLSPGSPLAAVAAAAAAGGHCVDALAGRCGYCCCYWCCCCYYCCCFGYYCCRPRPRLPLKHACVAGDDDDDARDRDLFPARDGAASFAFCPTFSSCGDDDGGGGGGGPCSSIPQAFAISGFLVSENRCRLLLRQLIILLDPLVAAAAAAARRRRRWAADLAAAAPRRGPRRCRRLRLRRFLARGRRFPCGTEIRSN